MTPACRQAGLTDLSTEAKRMWMTDEKGVSRFYINYSIESHFYFLFSFLPSCL